MNEVAKNEYELCRAKARRKMIEIANSLDDKVMDKIEREIKALKNFIDMIIKMEKHETKISEIPTSKEPRPKPKTKQEEEITDINHINLLDAIGKEEYEFLKFAIQNIVKDTGEEKTVLLE